MKKMGHSCRIHQTQGNVWIETKSLQMRNTRLKLGREGQKKRRRVRTQEEGTKTRSGRTRKPFLAKGQETRTQSDEKAQH